MKFMRVNGEKIGRMVMGFMIHKMCTMKDNGMMTNNMDKG